MELSKVWQHYKKTGDREARNYLIKNYIELVKVTAGRLKSTINSTSVELDDLVSYGIIGLMDAIEKFDINKKVKFETYAQLRIRGAMIDHLRKYDWAPRSLRQKSKEVEEAYLSLENKLGRSPTDREVARELDMDVDQLLDLLGQINALAMTSLEEMLEKRMESKVRDNGDNGSSQPEKVAVEGEIKRILAETINNLPRREGLVVTLYYYEDLTYKEIGKILGISESRVSQLHTKAIMKLRSKLSRYESDLTV